MTIKREDDNLIDFGFGVKVSITKKKAVVYGSDNSEVHKLKL